MFNKKVLLNWFSPSINNVFNKLQNNSYKKKNTDLKLSRIDLNNDV